jgi:hypothetical protein
VLEILLPEYVGQLLENYQNVFIQVASQLRWLHFDDASRLVTRVGWVDDGWIRVRVEGWSALDINMVEILRELSWTFYSMAESNRLLGNLDVTLSTLSRLVRWGRDVMPVWIHGGEVTAPVAGTALASWTVPTGKTGFIYGFFISAGEGNEFKVNWTSGGLAYSRRIIFPGKGTLHFVDVIALNEGLPADGGTSVTITNVNAGSEGIVYQVALLVVAV